MCPGKPLCSEWSAIRSHRFHNIPRPRKKPLKAADWRLQRYRREMQISNVESGPEPNCRGMHRLMFWSWVQAARLFFAVVIFVRASIADGIRHREGMRTAYRNLPRAIRIVTVPRVMLVNGMQLRPRKVGMTTYDVIVRVAISPNDMGGISSDPRIPSSQPAHWHQSTCTRGGWRCRRHTSDDPACTDGCCEVASTQGCVESGVWLAGPSTCTPKHRHCLLDSLCSFVVWCLIVI